MERSGKQLRRLETAYSPFTWLPGGRLITLCGDHAEALELCLIDPTTGRKLRSLRYVADEEEGQLWLQGTQPHAEEEQQQERKQAARALAKSAGLDEDQRSNPSVDAIAASRDGRLVALAVDATGFQQSSYPMDEDLIALVELRTGKVRHNLTAHARTIRSLAFSADGTILAGGSYDGTLRPLRSLRGHRGWITSLAFFADGKRLATASTDTMAYVWDVGGLP